MFRSKYTFEQRNKEAEKMIQKYPGRCPIICEKVTNSTDPLPQIDKTKYLVPRGLTFGQMVFVIRKRLNLNPEIAIFIFVNNNQLPPSSFLIEQVYEQYKDADGFLYMTYAGENTFGFFKI